MCLHDRQTELLSNFCYLLVRKYVSTSFVMKSLLESRIVNMALVESYFVILIVICNREQAVFERYNRSKKHVWKHWLLWENSFKSCPISLFVIMIKIITISQNIINVFKTKKVPMVR